MAEITDKDIEHIATLARIRLSDEQKTKLASELKSVLSYIDKLNEVSTDGVEPTARVTSLRQGSDGRADLPNAFRPDLPYDDGVSLSLRSSADLKDLLLGQAPATQGHLVKVKAILKQEK